MVTVGCAHETDNELNSCFALLHEFYLRGFLSVHEHFVWHDDAELARKQPKEINFQ